MKRTVTGAATGGTGEASDEISSPTNGGGARRAAKRMKTTTTMTMTMTGVASGKKNEAAVVQESTVRRQAEELNPALPDLRSLLKKKR